MRPDAARRARDAGERTGQEHSPMPILSAPDRAPRRNALAAALAILPALAAALADPPPAPDELTEHAAERWEAGADGSWATVADDTARVAEGAASLRFETGGAFDTWLFSPPGRDAEWNLLTGGAGGMRFLAYAENDFPFQNASPWVRLHTPGGYAEYRPARDLLNDAIGRWAEFTIPYAGNATWTRTDVGDPDLRAVNSIQIHADTWDAGFILWIDGLRFDLPRPAPDGLRAYAGDSAVELAWEPYDDRIGNVVGYAVYREPAPFDDVSGLVPLDILPDPDAESYTDQAVINGRRYHYAVTALFDDGSETERVESVGPRTPRRETDLQIVSISRTPRYPRYDPIYTRYEITEPNGFGPYIFTAATGLGSGQDGNTQRWPEIGQTVTYTATVRNRGTTHFAGPVPARWSEDGQTVWSGQVDTDLAPGQTTTFAWSRPWDDAHHQLTASMSPDDDRPDNNERTAWSKSVAFLSYADRTYIENFREESPDYDAITDDLFDWLNAHTDRFNAMFADAGTAKRIHFDVLAALEDDAPDPDAERINFAIFPFRYLATDGTLRLSGYYAPDEDLDYGLLHEMGHQLGLIDLYRLDTPAERNHVSGQTYWAIPCLMHGVSRFLSPHSAGAMEHWLDTAHGYYGQYLYAMPEHCRLRLLDRDGGPLAGATVRVYQRAERPGRGELITDQIKFQGVTDTAGEWTLPNVPVDPDLVPTTHTGDSLGPNPFGYVAVVGTNGLLLLEVEHEGQTDHAWLPITEVNDAHRQGHTGLAVFERTLALGGGVEHFPPPELTEENADRWAAGADDGLVTLEDDHLRVREGEASLRFEATGGADTWATYPGRDRAAWDLSAVQAIHLSAWAENDNLGFQNGSPWIRLRGERGDFIELRSTREILNDARGRWLDMRIPIEGDADWARTASGNPDIAAIRAIEIHADTWGAGFTVWWDGLRFDPPVCPADFNADGRIDTRDVIAFLNAWSDGDPRADTNGDGTVDTRDVADFLNRWTRGC